MNNYRTFRIIIVVTVGILTIRSLVNGIDHELLNFVSNLFWIVIATNVFIWIIIADTRQYSRTKNKLEFLPLTLFVTMAFSLSVILYCLALRDNSPTKLYCVTKIVDFNGASFDFREDNTYKFTSSCLLGADYYRGTYTIKDSFITLDTSTIEKIIVTNRLLIRPETQIYEKDTTFIRSIYQVDAQGRIIDDATDFIIRDKKLLSGQ